MKLRLFASIFITKILIKLCRVFKFGGTTLPGKIARKIYPNVLKDISKGFIIVMVTGTNGKTTTTKIINQIFKENNINFLSNVSGANLFGGVITAFIDKINLNGKSNIKYALIEIDEAAFKEVSKYIEPDYLVVTNFFRDQLDRYGELYSTLKGVQLGIEKFTNTTLILNADDSLCSSLAKGYNGKILYFGLSEDSYDSHSNIQNYDAIFCMFCKAKYTYKNRVFGHLGKFECPNCGYKSPILNISCSQIYNLSNTQSKIQISIEEAQDKIDTTINLPGLYNIYNALAAASVAVSLNFPYTSIINALNSFESGFGRMETIKTENKKINIILVKNPTGFNQVLSFLLTDQTNFNIAFIINDNLADGTDISWLWDVDFEILSPLSNINKVYTLGKRAYDMAVRLKYSGFDINKIHPGLEPNQILEDENIENLYILPTYTAMLDIRKVLSRKFKLKEFWK